MSDISELTVRVSMDTSDFKKGAGEIKKESEKVKDSVSSVEKAGSSTQSSGKKFGVLNQVLGSFSGNYKKSTKAISGISGAFKGLGGSAAGAGASLLAAGGIAGIAAMAVVGGLKKVYRAMSDLVSFASPEEFQQSSIELKQTVANFKQVLGTALTPIFQALQGALKGVVETLTQVAYGLIQIGSFVSEVFGLSNAFEGLSTSVDSATAGFASFDKVTTINDQDQYSSDLKTVKEIASRIQDAKKVAQDVRKFFTDIQNAWNSFGDDFVRWWNGLGDRIGNALSSAFQKVIGALQSVFKGVGNMFISVINKVINAYNNTIGNFRIDNDMLNVHFGFPKLNELPALAYGGVVSPNMPFIVGDNRTEKEAVAPLSTLQSMIDQAVKNAGGTGTPTTIPVSIELDGKTLARATYTYNQNVASHRANLINGLVR